MFGALAPRLKVQLAAYWPKHQSTILQWQLDADAVTRLAVRRLLTDREVARARQRLVTRMEKELTLYS